MKKLKLQRILAGVLALVLIGTFTACDNRNAGSINTDNSSKNNSDDEEIEFLVNPEDYRGTTVTYVTWRDPDANEDGPVIDYFEEKYGIIVDVQLVDEGNYVNAISASIASGTQGDIALVSDTFPGALKVMQPLDKAKINFDDPIWNRRIIEASTLDGHPYLLDAYSNIWTESGICLYNKKLFEDNNITSPAEYYEAGKWTFEAFRECAKQIKALGKGYMGAEVVSEELLGAAGVGVFSYKDGKISPAIDNHFYEVMEFVAQMNADGYAEVGRTNFATGKYGMSITNCFALKKTGYYSNMSPELIGATYLPTWEEGGTNYTSKLFRGWGLIKGAKNPEAAGIFLREYLDVNNYDLDYTFHSKELADFFFKVNSQENDAPFYYYSMGVYTATGLGQAYHNNWQGTPPTQIRGFFEKNMNVINNMANKATELISTEREWLKDNYK